MKHVLALLVAGAALSGMCAYVAVARPAAGGKVERATPRPTRALR